MARMKRPARRIVARPGEDLGDAFTRDLIARRPHVVADLAAHVVELAEAQVLAEFGERCPDHEPGCPTCDAWADHDAWAAQPADAPAPRPDYWS